MKNLQLLELISKPSNSLSSGQVFAETPDATYFLTNNTLHKHDFIENATTEVCPLSFDRVTHIKVLTIEKKICLVALDTINIVDPDGNNEVKTLNFHDNIAAISWNSTEEIVAVVFESGNVATYSFDYENGEVFPQGESSVAAKIPDTVYVGWGSKDTQFRGSEGKLKNQTPVETKPVEDQKPRISWRGNGEMFVVNYWVDQKRMFVVFETPCKALFRSEECPGLQPQISWRPTGNMIATVAETNKQRIVIFEKNGQKRFTFDMDFGNVVVQELKWSPCAQILTILTKDVKTHTHTIHLLMSSNYQWYEKQTLRFRPNTLLNFEWLESTQFTFTLKVVTTSETIKYVFTHVVCKSSGVCAVINGKTLQITNFKDSVVPPILYSQKITHSSPINFVSIDHNLVSIVDSENHLKVVDISAPETIITSVGLGAAVQDLSTFPLSCHHFTLQSSVLYFGAEVSSDTVIYNLDCKTGGVNFVDVSTEPVRHFLPSKQSFSSCNSQNIVRQDVAVIDDYSYTCQLSSNCHFYLNDEKINDCVNSFVIFGAYLLFTTKLNEIQCLRLRKDFRKDNIYRRSIEQGATIVTAIDNSPKIVLQLPRGNLETISCRLISIDILDRLLNDKNWEEALRFIRLEKLNGNLLFDLDPERFLGQIDGFITGATTINELNTLCLEFEEGSVLTTIYKNSREVKNYPGKIPAIFGAIFKWFDSVDYADYITTIVIINLNFFTLREALVYLQDLLRRAHTEVSLKQKLTEAINTLKTYGCDQNKLYTEALLLYDLDLAHFVASCCQLDPRIYEPHLNNLKNLPEVTRRYEINLYGKKPKSAIPYLLRCPKSTSETILSFIQTHGVYREAYESCSKHNRHFQIVSRAFSQSLSRQGSHHEAGVVLKRCGLLEEALEEFTLSLKWREALDVLEVLKFDEVAKMRVVNELGRKLAQSHMIKDAAILYEFYARNYEMAVKVLLENYFFEEAIHIARKHSREDIIVSEVLPLLSKHRCYLEERLTDLRDIFCKYTTRLAQVRKNKAEKFSNVGEYEDGDERDDLFSDVGSTITRSSRSSRSRSSTASSRNRRKEEKKKQNLREGGMYEDIALIRALHGTIKEIYSRGEEVRTCCILLLQESNVSYNEIKKFHDFYLKIHNDVKNGVSQIWPPHFCANNQTQNVQELADLENFEHLDVEYRTSPIEEVVWKLGLF